MATISAAAAAAKRNEPSPPLILLVSLAFDPYFDEPYLDLIEKLKTQAQVRRVTDCEVALAFLAQHRLDAVIATDQSIAEPGNRAVLDELVRYTRSGGVVVFGMLFSTMTDGPNMTATFARFGLPWISGAYRPSTYALNRRAIHNMEKSINLWSKYSQKAMRVARVAPQNALYVEPLVNESDEEYPSECFLSRPINRVEAAIAWFQVGDGNLGYIGDVNVEEGSEVVFMTMCGF